MITTRNTLKSRLVWLLFAFLVAGYATAGAADETFNVLQVGTRMYTNVTVTTKSKTYVFILHSAGMTTIQVQDLPPEIQQKLGYGLGDISGNPAEVSARGFA